MSTKTVLSAKVRNASYWTSTSIIALAFLSGGVAYLGRVGEPVRGMAELGYPAYFVTILGVWKALGALALVAPRFPRLKEWAYAGIAFDLIGAAASHAAVGHPTVRVIAPLILLAITAVSWALRPASRTLAARPGKPASSSGAQELARREIPLRFSELDRIEKILRLDVQSARARASFRVRAAPTDGGAKIGGDHVHDQDQVPVPLSLPGGCSAQALLSGGDAGPIRRVERLEGEVREEFKWRPSKLQLAEVGRLIFRSPG